MNSPENVQKSELMNLPEELLLHILKFVNISSRYDVSQVCRKFYELVCTLEKDCRPLELSYDQIYDDKIFNSVVKTLREFSNITINLSVDIVPKIETILMKFGKRIKKCTLLGVNGKGVKAKILESQLARMLNCIPNVEDFTFESICVERDVHWCDELHLYKLKKLTIRLSYIYDYSTIFNQVPEDVVTEMCISISCIENVKDIQQFINRQTQITKLIMKDGSYGCDLSVLKLSKLEHLTIRSCEGYEMNIAKMIIQNPKLRSLDLDIICTCFDLDEYDDDDTGNEILTAICELKYLESLNISINKISSDVFESLTKIITLRELHLNYQNDDQFYNKLSKLCVLKLLRIEALTIKPSELIGFYNYNTIIPEDIIFQFSQNFQNLKHLSFENKLFNIIGTVLKYFIKLETFEFVCNNSDGDQDNFVIDEDIKHENLKEFKVKNIESHNMKSILNTISACPNLELVKISGISDISHQGLKQILDDHLKLKYLKLGMYDFNFQGVTAELIKSAALQSISLSGLSQFLSLETIKEFFKEEFSCIKLFKTGWRRWSYFKLVMKKCGPLK